MINSVIMALHEIDFVYCLSFTHESLLPNHNTNVLVSVKGVLFFIPTFTLFTALTLNDACVCHDFSPEIFSDFHSTVTVLHVLDAFQLSHAEI